MPKDELNQEDVMREAALGCDLANREYPTPSPMNNTRLRALGVYLFATLKGENDDNLGKIIARVLKAAHNLPR